MLIFILFILGLIVGSFLNAVIFRLHAGESFWGGHSHCMHCKHELGPKDLVPVLSFALLGGKCRYCHKKLSWQYPAVELLTAIVFAAFGFHYGGFAWSLIRDLFFVGVFIVIGVYDLKHYLILDRVLVPNLIIATVAAISFDVVRHCGVTSIHCQTGGGILSGLLVAGFFYLQYVLSRGKWIGLGDVKLAFLFGMVLGWPLALVGLFIAYLAGAAVGLGLIAAGKKHLSSRVPFGAFLAAAVVITLLYGPRLLSWYLTTIGY
jgi:prepilin signal peptidase PulO-like enzyme (type II secretory pathway)